jgi:hypothetical protein
LELSYYEEDFIGDEFEGDDAIDVFEDGFVDKLLLGFDVIQSNLLND